jgi:hypothetical protein
VASSFTFQVKGLDNVLKRLQQFPKETQERALEAIEDNVQIINREQVRRAPTHLGTLKQQTKYTFQNGSYILFSNAEYAHIVEFGSKEKVKIQYPETAAYAATFKGKPTGGSWEDFVRHMEIWVKRKGIGATYNVSTRRKNRQGKSEIRRIAETIAFYIAKHGVSPQPYFFAPFFERRPQILKDVKAAINAK